jgi:hypothetical protein
VFGYDRIHEAGPHLGPEGLGSRPVRGAVGTDEDDVAVGVALDAPAAFVNEAVMVGAQGDEVVEVGGATLGPVDDVVGVGPAETFTAGNRQPWSRRRISRFNQGGMRRVVRPTPRVSPSGPSSTG